VENRDQRRVDELQRLGLPDELRQDDAPQGLQKAPQPEQPAVQRGGGPESDQAREQGGKESPGVAQERAAGLDAPKLLEEREGEELRVREALEGLVAAPFGVEPVVGIVEEAEEDGERLFRWGGFWSILRVGHPVLLWSGKRSGGLFLHHQTSQQTSSREEEGTSSSMCVYHVSCPPGKLWQRR
jgi:hypothetical protein